MRSELLLVSLMVCNVMMWARPFWLAAYVIMVRRNATCRFCHTLVGPTKRSSTIASTWCTWPSLPSGFGTSGLQKQKLEVASARRQLSALLCALAKHGRSGFFTQCANWFDMLLVIVGCVDVYILSPLSASNGQLIQLVRIFKLVHGSASLSCIAPKVGKAGLAASD